jgi:PAS domain S-box-containing protein
MVFIVIFGLIGTFFAVTWNQNRLADAKKDIGIERLSRLKNALASSLEARISTLMALDAYVHSYKNFAENKEEEARFRSGFVAFSEALNDKIQGVLSLQLAPDGVVVYVTNLERNSKAIGHDLLVDDARRDLVLATIAKRTGIVAGPLTLIQGGNAIIARSAIFTSPGAFAKQRYMKDGRATENTPWLNSIPDDFWGLATVVIETKALFDEAALNEVDPDFRIAIRGRDGLGESGEVFFGEKSVFDKPLAKTTIALPGGSWVMAIQGAPASFEPSSLGLLVAGVLMTTMLALFVASQRGRLHLLANEEARSKYLQEVETARHVAEAAQSRLNATLELAQIGIFDWDVKNDTFEASPIYYSMLGYPAESGPGDRAVWLDRLHPDDRARVAETIASVLSKQANAYSYEARMRDATGAYRWLSVKAFSFERDEEGLVTRALGIRTDITERKHSEEELERHKSDLEHLVSERTAELEAATKQAENANQAKSAFLANMSHEIRTPMNAVIGLSQLALGTDLDELQRDYITKVLRSSRALLGILNDILDYSKIEAGSLEVEQVDFSLEDTLRATSDLFAVHAEEKGLELFIDIGPDVPDRLKGDPLRFGQVVSNLVGNAIKFTDHGEIHIRVEATEQTERSVVLRVAVRDTGIGITHDQANRLFQPFTQADATVTRKFGGTGLGLTISKRLVELMGGQITLSSEPGHGSTFVFTVRFGLAGPKSGEHLTGRALGDLSPMRSLVVDDQETSRTILRSILEHWHFKVTTAASGAEAVRLYKEAQASGEPFNLLLLDWKMPGMDGTETALAIEEASNGEVGGRLPKIIMVSALGREELLKETQGLDIDAVITKPVTPSSLFDTIIQLQQGHFSSHADVADALAAARLVFERIHGARILLVEDNELNQQVAQGLLATGGLTVVVAKNGQEALDRVAESDFDAVLMDIHMPLMDGFEATRRIRSQAQHANLPIIAMTAAAMVQDREACTAAGMNDHVSKPIDPRELAEKLAKWISHTAGDIGNQPSRMPELDETVISAQIETLERALPGISVRDSVARIGGNALAYRRVLLSFAEKHSDTAARLRILHLAGEMKQLSLEVHSLKGIAGNLGLGSIRTSAELLERAMNSDDKPAFDHLIESLALECERSVAVLRQFASCSTGSLPAETHEAESAMQPTALDTLKPQLVALADQLKDRSISARHLARDIGARIQGTSLSMEWAEVSQAIAQLRYDAASKALERLLNSLTAR